MRSVTNTIGDMSKVNPLSLALGGLCGHELGYHLEQAASFCAVLGFYSLPY